MNKGYWYKFFCVVLCGTVKLLLMCWEAKGVTILRWCVIKFFHTEHTAVALSEGLDFCIRVILGGRTGSRFKSKAKVDYRN